MKLLVNNVLWIISAVVLLLVSISLLYKIGDASDGYEQYWQSNSQRPEINVSECCIATVFDEETALNAIVLGNSLQNLGIDNIRIFAFSKYEAASEKQAIIQSLFNYTQYTFNRNERNSTMEKFWIANQCKRVVYATPTGIFNKFPIDACKSTGFASVAKLNDIAQFDYKFFAVDPEQIEGHHIDLLFNEKVRRVYNDYNPLPTESCVKDYASGFLDFWTRFATPTFVRYSPKTFENALSGKSVNADRYGSIYLYPLIKKSIDDANSKYKLSNMK